MHICYAVACDQDTSYADLAYISARAALLVHPQMKISMLVDEKTFAILKAVDCKALQVAHDVVVVPCPYEGVVERSRFVKTSARKHLQGDFLMIDADATPVRSLQEIFELDCDVAAAMDMNDETGTYLPEQWVFDLHKKLYWESDLTRYYNGGVIYARDTPKSHEFFDLWHEYWKVTLATGSTKDQPSLNHALFVTKPRIHALPPKYNAMIHACMDRARGAVILHFFKSFTSNYKYKLFLLQASMTKDNKPCELDEEMLRDFVRTGYAWSDPYFVNAQWHSGRYFCAAKAVAVKLIRKLFPRFAHTPDYDNMV